MDVKDLQRIVSNPQPQSVTSRLQRAVSALTGSSIKATKGSDSKVTESVHIEGNASRSNEVTALRSKANTVINIVNVASEATSEIEKLVKSVEGIFEQASSSDTTDARRAILQDEAAGILEAIKSKALNTSSDNVKPLAGDPISLEIDDKSGKLLEVILPDDAKIGFAIDGQSLTRKDAILQTRDQIAKAKERLENLKQKVGDTRTSVYDALKKVEVAIQNSEASKATVRDVDDAIRLASDAKSSISSDPKAALKSFGKLDTKALDLL